MLVLVLLLLVVMLMIMGANVGIGERTTIAVHGPVAIIDNITIVAGRILLVMSYCGRVPTAVDIVQQVRCRYSFSVLVLVLRVHCIRTSTVLGGFTEDEGTIRTGTDFGNVLRCRRRRRRRVRRHSGCFVIATDDGRPTRTGTNFRRIVAGTGTTTGYGHRIVHRGRRRVGRRGDCRVERRGRQLVRFYRW